MRDLSYLSEVMPAWFRANARALPWRENAEPYRVWLSEIMLQQTRVEAVIGYYQRFLDALPDLKSLAAASEAQVLKLWEGLGYYSRARNLQKAARVVVNDRGGSFPDTYPEILALPGVGPYTAGAIASICFDKPTPAVDGNVLRVVSRLETIAGSVDSPGVRTAVREALLPAYRPGLCGVMTQSLMELGACVCVPNGAPRCEACPVRDRCAACQTGTWDKYPVRDAKKPRKRLDKCVLLLRRGERFAVRKRPEKGLLAGLWEFPWIDADEQARRDPRTALAQAEGLGAKPVAPILQTDYTHVFTHVEWHMTAHLIDCGEAPDAFTWVTPEELTRDYALPSAFRPFLTLAAK